MSPMKVNLSSINSELVRYEGSIRKYRISKENFGIQRNFSVNENIFTCIYYRRKLKQVLPKPQQYLTTRYWMK